jgi:glycosyltransferase involved in cell wall biosynthesis
MPRIYYLAHDIDEPRGGISVLYDHVAELRAAGYDAYIVHTKEGFRYPYGRADAPVLNLTVRLPIDSKDCLVVPEDHRPGLAAMSRAPCRKLVFCQNHYYIYRGLAPPQTWQDFGVEAILAVSEPIRAALAQWFGVVATIIPPAIDSSFFVDADNLAFGRFPPSVAFMPRMGALHLNLVRGLLQTAAQKEPALAVRWQPIDGCRREEVAAILKQSTFFLAIAEREGLGLPPLEAMAAGALVVGFKAGGGHDYASPDNGIWIPDGDGYALASGLGAALRRLAAAGPGVFAEFRTSALATAHRYGREAQRKALLSFWRAFLAA